MSMKEHFRKIADEIFNDLHRDERAFIEYAGEDTQFMRFNNAKVRQSGTVHDAYLTVSLLSGRKRGKIAFPISGNVQQDRREVEDQMAAMRREVAELPDDPYLVEPADHGKSETDFSAVLPEKEKVADDILGKAQDLDLTGIYAGGRVMRGIKNSAGTEHWFSAENYSVDFSIITDKEKMIKGTVAGNKWDRTDYERQLSEYRKQLLQMKKEPATVKAGKHRVYLAPAAVADLVTMLSWNGISEAAIRQGASALIKLREGEKWLSEKFNLKENFSSGLVPRFNEQGMRSDNELSLIEKGKLRSTLVNPRTAKEYGISDNAANSEEELRAPEMSAGSLKQENILKELGEGLYLSNLHYLNWSDLAGGRITGMTRYACFKVEDGEIVAPIENMRFDETLYHFFGDKLIDLTDFTEVIPETSTYFMREIGGSRVPGILVDDFTFNL